jgi:hypothetical protein
LAVTTIVEGIGTRRPRLAAWHCPNNQQRQNRRRTDAATILNEENKKKVTNFMTNHVSKSSERNDKELAKSIGDQGPK